MLPSLDDMKGAAKKIEKELSEPDVEDFLSGKKIHKLMLISCCFIKSQVIEKPDSPHCCGCKLILALCSKRCENLSNREMC